jgi:hypothetical protein
VKNQKYEGCVWLKLKNSYFFNGNNPRTTAFRQMQFDSVKIMGMHTIFILIIILFDEAFKNGVAVNF